MENYSAHNTNSTQSQHMWGSHAPLSGCVAIETHLLTKPGTRYAEHEHRMKDPLCTVNSDLLNLQNIQIFYREIKVWLTAGPIGSGD